MIDDSNKCNPIYERYDEENNKYYPISIFDTKNARYEQYGANQGCFEEIYFYRLLENPLVIEEYLKQFGINIKIEVLDGFKEPNVDDIVAGENYNLYDTGNNITGSYDHYGVNPHYVYVTDKKENKIIVSSWGKLFEFDNRDAKWTSMIKIKVLKTSLFLTFFLFYGIIYIVFWGYYGKNKTIWFKRLCRCNI